jgi:beta-phosphoglucomutase-like phosphatase (HAD superfamily)
LRSWSSRAGARLHQRLPRHGQRDGDDDRHRRAEAEDRGLDRGDPELRDLGYGDVRTLPGPVAWIDEPRRARKRRALVSSSEAAESAAEPAGMRDRFDAVSGRRGTRTLARALAVDVDPAGTTAAREAGFEKAIVVADLQELLGFAR